jgi:hypothetical protein
MQSMENKKSHTFKGYCDEKEITQLSISAVAHAANAVQNMTRKKFVV